MIPLLFLLLFVSCTLFAYEVLTYTAESGFLGKTATKLFKISESKYKRRRIKKEKILLEEGNVKDKSFINKIDLLIENSQIKKVVPINTEIYITLNIILVLLGFIIGNTLFNYWVISFFISILIVLILYSILYFMSIISNQKVERETIKFINLVENFSDTNDDIVSIMGKVAAYLEEPLKSYVDDFYNEAMSTGDITRSFRHMEYKIQNERLKDIIRNLEICSRHQANYSEIIKANRSGLKVVLKSRQKIKAIVENARTEMAICLFLCGGILAILNLFLSDMLGKNIILSLTDTFVGSLILFYCIANITWIIWKLIVMDKEV